MRIIGKLLGLVGILYVAVGGGRIGGEEDERI